MFKFSIPCYLHNNDFSIILRLIALGYEPLYMSKMEYNLRGKNLVIEADTFHCTDSDNHPNCIDCGNDVDKFIMLAMVHNNPNDRNYYSDGSSYFYGYKTDAPKDGYRMLTKEEVIEHIEKIQKHIIINR